MWLFLVESVSPCICCSLTVYRILFWRWSSWISNLQKIGKDIQFVISISYECIYVPDQIRIWSGPNPYTHMVGPYAHGHQRVRPNRYTHMVGPYAHGHQRVKPNRYTHMVGPYAHGHQRVKPNRYLDNMRIKWRRRFWRKYLIVNLNIK